MSLQLKLMPNLEGSVPIKGSSGSAGYDLASAMDILIPIGTRVLVSTGLRPVNCPTNTYLRIAPRSGLACRGIDIGAGVVDSDYRGEIKVMVINNSKEAFSIKIGDRIAQLIPEMICPIQLECLDPGGDCVSRVDAIVRKRGVGGFGSTNYQPKSNKLPQDDPLQPTYPSDSIQVMEDKIRNAWLC